MTESPAAASFAYYLGCPVWACARWSGKLYTHQASRDEWLNQYGSVFNTVEGNSTFYAIPAAETYRRWIADVPDGFRFCFKFPRTISHEHRLLDVEQEVDDFLQLLMEFHEADRLGPAFLQLPPGFAPHHLDDLQKFLERLPAQLAFAVEVRHLDFFEDAGHRKALADLLVHLHIDQVIYDTRALFSGPAIDDQEQQWQRQRPKLPVQMVAHSARPMVRFVGGNDLERNIPFVREWSRTIARWIKSGLTPYVFTHTPDDLYAPYLARMFHEHVAQQIGDLRPLPAWPGELDESGRQLELF